MKNTRLLYFLTLLFLTMILLPSESIAQRNSIKGFAWILPWMAGSAFGFEKKIKEASSVEFVYSQYRTVKKTTDVIEEIRLRPSYKMYFRDEGSCRCLDNYYVFAFYEYSRSKVYPEDFQGANDPTAEDYRPSVYFKYLHGAGAGIGKLFIIKERFAVDINIGGIFYQEKDYSTGEKKWKNDNRISVLLGYMF